MKNADGGNNSRPFGTYQPPSAFFIIALFIVIIRTWKPEQVEDAEFVMKPQSKGMAQGGGH